MKYYKVQIETLKVLPLRRVETGMKMARSVENPEGQTIVGSGTELTDALRLRLKKFKVNRVAVLVEEEQWLSEDEYHDLDGEPKILEKKVINGKERNTVLEEEPDTSASKLSELTKWIDSEIRRRGELNRSGDYQELVNQANNFHDRLDTIMDKIEQHSASSLNVFRDLLQSNTQDIPDQLDFAESESINLEAFKLLEENLSLRDQLRERSSTEEIEIPLSCSERDFESFEDVIKLLTEGNIMVGLSVLKNLNDEELDQSPNEEFINDLMLNQMDIRDEDSNLRNRLYRDIDDSQELEVLLNYLDETGDIEIPLEERVGESLLENQTSLLERLEFFVKKRNNHFDDVKAMIQNFTDELPDKWPDISSANPCPTPEVGTGASTIDFDDETPPNQETTEIQDVSSNDLTSMLESLEIDDRPQLQSQFDAFRSKAEKLEQKQSELRNELPNEPDTEAIEKILRGERESDEDTLKEIEDHPELLQRIVGFLKERSEFIDKVSQTVRETEGTHDEQWDKLNRILKTLSKRKFNPVETMELLGSVKRTSNRFKNKRERSLERAIERRNPEEISRWTDLPYSVVKSLEDRYELPTNTGDGDRLLENIRDFINDITYRSKFDRDRAEPLATQIKELYDSNDQPVRLIKQPPRPNRYFLTHAFNTALITGFLSQKQGLDDDQIKEAIQAGLLLELGMAFLPLRLILDNSELEDRWRREMIKHPIYSEKVVGRSNGSSSGVSELVGQHHERVNGKGYPRGLDRTNQQSPAPILQIADAYTALLEKRQYQGALNPYGALKNLEGENGYDPDSVSLLKQTIGYYPNGLHVLLTDGRVATVARQTDGYPEQPHVLIQTDKQQKRVSNPQVMNLAVTSIYVKKILKWK